MEINEVMKPGITGFCDASEEWGQQNKKQFEAYLFYAIRTENGELIVKEPFLNNKNFYSYQLRHRSTTLHVLLHSIHPFVAYASAVDFSGIEFVDGPETISAILEPAYQVLPKALLVQTLSSDQIQTLRAYEQKMIKY